MCLSEITGKGDRRSSAVCFYREPETGPHVANCAAPRPNDPRQLGSERASTELFHCVIRRLVCLTLHSSVIHSIPLPRVPPTSMFVPPPPVHHHTVMGAYIKRKNIVFFTKPLIIRDTTAKCNCREETYCMNFMHFPSLSLRVKTCSGCDPTVTEESSWNSTLCCFCSKTFSCFSLSYWEANSYYPRGTIMIKVEFP